MAFGSCGTRDKPYIPPPGATRELSQRYRARHSKKSVQQNGDADRNAGMVFAARTGPPGSTVHFWEYSAGRGGCIRAGSVFLGQRDPPTDYLGWRTGSGAAISRVSRRAGPQNDADRAASPIHGVADGDRDAEYSGFCTVQAGVRWDGKGCPRLFMHNKSEIMQDNRASCAEYPDWGRHAPR